MPDAPFPAELSFSFEPLSAVLPALRAALAAAPLVAFTAPDPDAGVGLYAGEVTAWGVHRPYGVWVDVADRLGAHLLTPERAEEGRVRLRLRRDASGVLRGGAGGYGADAAFQRVDKLEDPAFLEDFLEALGRAPLRAGARVLAVGVNSARELRALALAYPDLALDVVGVDVDASALALAAQRFPAFTFVERDVNAAPWADLGRFDLIVALSVLQSPGVDLDRAVRTLTRAHLAPGGTVVFGFPNARYVDGRLSYGARLRNFQRPELSLLMKDVAQVRRYLQKHAFRVFVTGKHEVFVTGQQFEL
ncbi:class I SAM-dependent methyltransferase [Deinococcus maricopensis]|uniref:Methyltransferase type 12 n=1 Tax=Deinococcus maricopensis (strain DSM 21211 / LMG 22137 / NRRL B-23946 / LB-34) TaxID=709986 RepID=E8U4K8_DEIML|nr:class I SAM-dependent methyltransferase [Deinococcus maricopensis]ADV68873.1 Methyltransferase type 12 [Deinococcus maricopensis DSM 21211]